MSKDTTPTNDIGDSVNKEFSWSISSIMNLIEEGSNAEAINVDAFEKIWDLFNVASKLVTGDIKPDVQRDPLTYALNTTLGVVSRTCIIFALRVSRATKQKQEDWGKNNYSRYFDKGIEPCIWFGHFLPQVRYLDKDFAEQKISDFSKLRSEDKNWQYFMEGYLTSSYIYDDIYKLPAMKANYDMAIASHAFNQKEDERLVSHITIGYLRGNDELKRNNIDGTESLFWKLLHDLDTTEKQKRWLYVTRYFWSISKKSLQDSADKETEEANKEIAKRIIEFWRWSYNKNKSDEIKKLLGQNYNDFLGSLSDLTIYLDKIDDEAQRWLELSAPFAEISHMASFLIEYLTVYIEHDDSMSRIGKIYLKMLNGCTPTFRKEHIIAIVERLYKLKGKYPELKKDADDICNTYGERGEHFLKELYFKYQ